MSDSRREIVCIWVEHCNGEFDQACCCSFVLPGVDCGDCSDLFCCSSHLWTVLGERPSGIVIA